MIIHHHLIYQVYVNPQFGQGSQELFLGFFNDLLTEIGMECLIPPQIKLSHQNAWTGIMGIITSHIAFHYFVDDAYVQLDIYSCKEFDRKKTIRFLNKFWNSYDVKTLFIDRGIDQEFNIQ